MFSHGVTCGGHPEMRKWRGREAERKLLINLTHNPPISLPFLTLSHLFQPHRPGFDDLGAIWFGISNPGWVLWFSNGLFVRRKASFLIPVLVWIQRDLWSQNTVFLFVCFQGRQQDLWEEWKSWLFLLRYADPGLWNKLCLDGIRLELCITGELPVPGQLSNGCLVPDRCSSS